MKRIPATGRVRRQRGYALIIMVLGLMGVGGVVLAGFTHSAKESAEHERFLHNQRVLAEAKQALLQYAYNRVDNDGVGPGRLPNADTDNDGSPDDGSTFGRLPWDDPDLKLYDIRDADGQRLWYAVSSSFRPQASPVNNRTSGSIALKSQTGDQLIDGANGANLTQYGIAAVIIAPGPPVERNGALQDRSVDSAENYLDVLLDDSDPPLVIEDNATLVQGDPTDGFVLGPIDDQVNDQFIVITAAEVAAMAEKATLKAYRDSMEAYLVERGGLYPWLFNYRDVAAVEDLDTHFPLDTDGWNAGVDYHDNRGRIPSLFGRYFAINPNPTSLIRTELLAQIKTNFALNDIGIDGGGQFSFNAHTATMAKTFADLGVGFANPDSDIGRVVTDLPAADSLVEVIYFWDGHGGDATGNWSVCSGGGDSITDCHKDSSGAPTGGANDLQQEIMRIVITVDFPQQYVIDADYSVPPGPPLISDPEANRHARITGTIAGDTLDFTDDDSIQITVEYEVDRHFHEGEAFEIQESGDLVVADLMAASNLSLRMNYYPSLPNWAFTNEWNRSVLMAYAGSYRPGAPVDCTVNVDCLQIADAVGAPHDTQSLLVIAGSEEWTDPGLDGFQNDLSAVFDADNHNGDVDFFHHSGNDSIMVIR